MGRKESTFAARVQIIIGVLSLFPSVTDVEAGCERYNDLHNFFFLFSFEFIAYRRLYSLLIGDNEKLNKSYSCQHAQECSYSKQTACYSLSDKTMLARNGSIWCT